MKNTEKYSGGNWKPHPQLPSLKEHRINGVLHNDNGPSQVLFRDEANDVICHLRYYRDGVLHREDGPAVEFPNEPENSMYIIEGIGLKSAGWIKSSYDTDEEKTQADQLAKRIVMSPNNLTVEEIDSIQNQEIRRIAMTRMGIDKYVKESECEVLDLQANDVEGTKEALFKTKNNMFFFVGLCKSTGRMYTIPVDECKKCEEARAFLSSGKNINKCVGAS